MSLLLEALKRAERAKRQQAESPAEVAKEESPVISATAGTNTDAAPTADAAPSLELDLSGLEAFEASLNTSQTAPASSLAEAADSPAEDIPPLEFSLTPLDLTATQNDEPPHDSSTDLPTIEWSVLEQEATTEPLPPPPSSEAQPEAIPLPLTIAFDTAEPAQLPSDRLTEQAITPQAPVDKKEAAPLTMVPPPPEPRLNPETATASTPPERPTPVLSLETIDTDRPADQTTSQAATADATASQAPSQASKPPPQEPEKKHSAGHALEEARNKARRLLGKPAPATPEPAPPSRFTPRQLRLLGLLLGAAVIGAGGTYYVWTQLHPAPAGFIATNSPQPPSSPPPASNPQEAPATAEPAKASAPQASSSDIALLGLTTKDAAQNAADNLAKARLPSTPPAPETAPPVVAPAGPISITRTAPRLDVLDESVRQGFAAYDRGDYNSARQQYQRAVKSDPRNRQAILGLAAAEEAMGNTNAAATHYAQVLSLDPRDHVAQAALLSLSAADPLQGESKLRLLLADQPDRAFLHFALGNVLAAQQRWPEAEQAYFRANGLEPSNPDYEFNLAISLDQLHQLQPAREHYQRALDLAAKRPARFDQQSVRQRLEKLSAQP